MPYQFLFVFVFLIHSIHSQELSKSIKISSWNVFLRPAVLNDNQIERAKLIANYLLKDPSDVLVLQEVFHKKSRAILIENLRNTYPYYSLKGNSSFLGVNSGLLTFSKYPIKKTNFIYFKNLIGSDKLSKKGALSTKIVVENVPINIINTHFQAGKSDKKNKIRINQAQKIKKLKSLEDSIVLYCGDFNTDYYSEDYVKLKNELNILEKPPTLRSSNKYTANFSDHKLYPSKGNPERLDHLFLYSRNKQTKLRQIWIREPRINKKRLSDHNLVEGIVVIGKN